MLKNSRDKLKTFSIRSTRSQRREHLDEMFEADECDEDHVSDSDDDEYFPESEVAASDCDDAGNLHFYFLLCTTTIIVYNGWCFIYCVYF
jgi:hypothetical protein